MGIVGSAWRSRAAAAALVAIALGVLGATSAVAAEKKGATLEQCANGPSSAFVACDTASGKFGYSRGNLNGSKSHYSEGDFVPARIVASGLVPNAPYTVTVGYDFTDGGVYAIDYLGSYDATESVGNNPCAGVAGCSLGTFTTFAVPTDAHVTAGFDGQPGTADDITQAPGFFTAFGGTITSVSSYTLEGSTTGNSSKQVSINFTAGATSSVVLAYGVHLSRRADWGSANSSVSLSGSLHHRVAGFSGDGGGMAALAISAPTAVEPA